MLVAGCLVACSACSLGTEVEPDPAEVVPSGTATVFGSALDMNFDFAPAQVTALYEERDGALLLDLNLCEYDCDLLGLVLEPESRAVLVNLQTTSAALVAGATFEVPTELATLAAFRYREPDQYTTAFATKIESAQSGRVVIDEVTLAPGGTVRGRFDFAMERGGALTGSFEAPLLLLQETGAGR